MSENRSASAGIQPAVLDHMPSLPSRLGTRIRRSFSQFGRPPRLMGIDVARGLAVFGMMGAHLGSTPWLDWSDPSTWGGVVNGRASILFAVLAGISIALATGGKTPPVGEALGNARLRMAGRALAILTIGLILEMMGTPLAVILPVYGVLFLMITPFLGWPRRRLFVASGGIALLAPLTMAVLSALTLGPTGSGLSLIVNGVYPLQTWLALMLGGMAIGRSDLSTVRSAVVLVVVGVLLAVVGYSGGSWVMSNDLNSSMVSSSSGIYDTASFDVPGTEVDITESVCTVFSDGWIMCQPEGMAASSGIFSGPSGQSWRDQFQAMGSFDTIKTVALGVDPHSGGTFEIIGSGGFALAVIGTSLLASRVLRPILIPIAAVGSMPLTSYAAHVVSYAVLVQPFGLMAERLGAEGMVANNGFWLANTVVLLVVCTLWALSHGRGPLERVTAWAARTMESAPAPSAALEISNA